MSANGDRRETRNGRVAGRSEAAPLASKSVRAVTQGRAHPYLPRGAPGKMRRKAPTAPAWVLATPADSQMACVHGWRQAIKRA